MEIVNKVKFTHEQVMSIYIVFNIDLWSFNVTNDFALENYLFETVESTKNANGRFSSSDAVCLVKM